MWSVMLELATALAMLERGVSCQCAFLLDNLVVICLFRVLKNLWVAGGTL
jgi:hypothetical protein